jgi:hypothetical protein
MTVLMFVLQQQPWLQKGSYQTCWWSAGRLDWNSKDKLKMYLYRCASREDVWGLWGIAPLTLKTKVGGQHHAPAALNPWRTRGTHITKFWLDVRDLEGSKKRKSLAPTRIRSPVRPAPIQSLYWLSYAGSIRELCGSNLGRFAVIVTEIYRDSPQSLMKDFPGKYFD